jgi:hypothetical protein
MTFERIRPETREQIDRLAEVHSSLTKNWSVLLGFMDSYCNLQLYWEGHCFVLRSEAELLQLREAVEFELMVQGAAERVLYA